MVFTPELLSVILGGASGFIFKYMAQRAQDEKEKFDRMMTAIDKADTSATLASKRETDASGQWIRRFLVITFIFGIILAPFILPFFDKNVIVEELTPSRSFLGIFNWGGVVRYYSLDGYLLSDEIKCGILAIIGYYFGQSAAQRR